MVYTTSTGTNGSAAAGVQQPYEISVLTGNEEAREINLSVSVCLNPATNYLTLEATDSESSALRMHPYDMNGTLLQNVKITDNQTSIAISNL